MNLHKFLGDKNSTKTIGGIQSEIDRVKVKCIGTLDLLAGIDYHIVRRSSKCVDVYIDRLLFDEIIFEMNVYVTIEVQ